MIPLFKLLSHAELQKIHETSLNILETVGIRVDGDEATKIFQSSGAIIESENIVKIPSSAVIEALRTNTSQVKLFHRNSSDEMVIGDGVTKHSAVGWTSRILDWKIGKYRDAKLVDLAESVQLCGAIDEISWFMSPLICSDVSASEQELYQFKVGVENSNKPIILSVSDQNTLDKILHLGVILAGNKEKMCEKPTFSIAVGLMSPLFLTSELCDISITCARLGIPIFLYTSSMAGATSPVTISGTLAGNHAETLAAVTLMKLVNPDAKILCNSYSKIFDMKAADVSPGNPEFGLLAAASVQLGKFIGLPSGTGMFFTDSPQMDMQAGMEKIGGSFLPLLSNSDFSSGMGMLGKATIHSCASLMADAEVVSYLDRIKKGFACHDDHLALDTYKEVKPMGNFLSTMHTVKYFRSELWNSKILYKESSSSWEENGGKDSMQIRIKESIENQLQNYKPPGLSGKFLDEFEKIKEG